MDVFTIQEKQRWLAALQRCCLHDWFHSPFFHALAEDRGEGEARLFVFDDGEYVIAIPLLLRSLSGIGAAGRNRKDASSVYGYVGPFASHPTIPKSVIEGFQASLRETLTRMNVISVFSRLHPLIPQSELLEGLGECVVSGQTVSIDLTLPDEVQVRKFRSNHRRDLKRLGKLGWTCMRSEEPVHMDAFIEMYHQTMRRNKAEKSYFFRKDYFDALADGMGPNLHLFVCLHGERPISGELITTCHGIVQYYLSATLDEYRHLAPTKLLIDYVRKWASERGARVMHLGGGLGAREDSLFRFKAGFSDRRHEFVTWQWICQPAVYKALCKEKEQSDFCNGLRAVGEDFFPLYRGPSERLGESRTLCTEVL